MFTQMYKSYVLNRILIGTTFIISNRPPNNNNNNPLIPFCFEQTNE